MNLLNKSICIIGFNQSFSPSLLKALLKQGCFINILAFPSDNIEYYLIKNSQNKIKINYINKVENLDLIKEANLIINLSLAPTPSNFNNALLDKINFNKNILLKTLTEDTLLINILPLLQKNLFSLVYRNISIINKDLAKKVNNYINLHTPIILSQRDSLLQDMKTTMNKFKHYPNFNASLYIIPENTLVENIIENINTFKISMDIETGSHNSYTISDIVEAVGTNDTIKVARSLYFKLINIIFKAKLLSFQGRYLWFIKNHKKPAICNQLDKQELTIRNENLKEIILQYIPKYYSPFLNYKNDDLVS